MLQLDQSLPQAWMVVGRQGFRSGRCDGYGDTRAIGWHLDVLFGAERPESDLDSRAMAFDSVSRRQAAKEAAGKLDAADSVCNQNQPVGAAPRFAFRRAHVTRALNTKWTLSGMAHGAQRRR